MIYDFLGILPNVSKDAFIAQGARIIGECSIDAFSSVWFNAVIRADVAGIKIGSFSNIQDNSTIHVASEQENKTKIPCIIKDYVTIGHNCVIHACTIEDNCLIGMGSVIMDGAIIGANSIVAANSLVTKGKVFPPNSLIQGSPAKVVRALSDEEIVGIKKQAIEYSKLTEKYKKH